MSRQAAGETAYWVPFLYRDALSLVQGREGSLTDEQEDEDEEELQSESLF